MVNISTIELVMITGDGANGLWHCYTHMTPFKRRQGGKGQNHESRCRTECSTLGESRWEDFGSEEISMRELTPTKLDMMDMGKPEAEISHENQ